MFDSSQHTIPIRLQGLYDLEQIDTELDELYETHGELPNELNVLTATRDEIAARLAKAEASANEAVQKRGLNTAEIAELQDKEKKYRDQQLNIKTNREYDALVREMEAVSKRIAELRAQFKVLDEQEAKARETAAAVQQELDAANAEVGEKDTEYQSARQVTNDEEQGLLGRRKEVVGRITETDMILYQRIRKARGGRAVAVVRRNSCGGCFNVVPHQKIVELHKLKSIITCEHCGRILVPEDMVAAQ